MKNSPDVPRVFVSSTLEDLKEFRDKAREACERAGFQALMCERWPAGGEPPLQTCLSGVDPAQVVIVLVAHRHGWTPTEAPGDGLKSITRLECEHAHASGKDVIPFIVSEGADWDRKLTEDYRATGLAGEARRALREEIGRNLDQLEAFKAWLNTIATRNIEGFRSPEELCKQVLHALNEWKSVRGIVSAGPTKAAIRAAYLRWLRRDCASVELLGLDANDSGGVVLSHVYVPAVTAAKDQSDGANRRQHWGEPACDLLLHRLGEASLCVPGAPGAGKSTFCRWLALVVAEGAVPAHPVSQPEEYEETLPEALSGRLPLLCRLRDWSGHQECTRGNGRWTRKQLEDSLAHWITLTRPGDLTAEVFREELEAGTCLLIFDGVDEVPEESGADMPRRSFLSGLADALPKWLEAGNRVVLTSRPYGLNEADRARLKLPVAEMLGMPTPLQETFIARWYGATDPPRAREKARGLVAHVNSRPELAELRSNPILLTALCVKYGEGQRLPADVFKLYQAITAQVLYKRYPSERQHDRPRVRLAAVALGMHRGSPERPRTTPAAEIDVDELDRVLCDLKRTDYLTEDGALDAAARREDLLSNSGLLLPRANRRAAFYHLSFQEFFAAVRLRYNREAPGAILGTHASTPEWRRTLVFLFCAFAESSPEEALEAFEPLEVHLEPQRLREDPRPALLLCDCLEVAHARGWNLKARYNKRLQTACDHALHTLNPPERANLWRTLGKLGWDDRPGVGCKGGLPDIAWTEQIPAGEFLFGEGKQIEWIEAPYSIARYPVTNAQVQAFVDDGGYETEEWWEGLAERPAYRESRWNIPNHPREHVSWFEAVAFCRWLTARLRGVQALTGDLVVRLPTEKEWERAARGTDGREYPWGEAWDQRRANGRDTWNEAGQYHIGQTTAVGLYATGESPVGALDMAGNVFEWCDSTYDANGDQPPEQAPRVVRGGSWYDLRGSCRFGYFPGYRNSYSGFRLACAPPIL